MINVSRLFCRNTVLRWIISVISVNYDELSLSYNYIWIVSVSDYLINLMFFNFNRTESDVLKKHWTLTCCTIVFCCHGLPVPSSSTFLPKWMNIAWNTQSLKHLRLRQDHLTREVRNLTTVVRHLSFNISHPFYAYILTVLQHPCDVVR